MDIRQILAIGTGIGIEIRDNNLEIVIARVRPTGIQVLGCTTILGYRERPAGDWGSEYAAFLKGHGVSHLAATVLLPRREVIVRQISLPGVAGKDLEAAIALQIDTLHPYGEDDVAHGWSPLGNGAVLVGIMRRTRMEEYLASFAEAGIAVASFTCSAAAMHAAVRLHAKPLDEGFLAVTVLGGESVEIYGESPSRQMLSAEFELPAERAGALGLAELRLPQESPVASFESILPVPRVNPAGNDLSRNALPYATALAGACPRLAPAANLLPPERRTSNSRAMLVPTAVLAGFLVLLLGTLFGYSAYAKHRYLKELEAEITKVEPQARRSAALEHEIDLARSRAALLDDFHNRTKADLDTLNELTQLLPPPVWTNSVELTRDAAEINGEAEQAAPLLKVLDASSYFQNSAFTVLAKNGGDEVFRIHTVREAQK